ncbi:hypothetical protein E6Q11_06345 [Candidatus Dojkabacteria bacterium]|uniref:Uncharacterized protein n=1 Tax=Candidatus Dojkabacteria bacterium TaxID=2099670 RepID=A0A5C7J2V3_9BACT|nr:MAG: hypothetical protein E6Q11_06345 [Candidatus Dojkabacteria bacterium]
MTVVSDSLDLRVVVHQEIRETIEAHPAVRDRAVTMLRSVLEVFRARGRWTYMLLGFGNLPNPSQYWMEVGASSEMMSSNMVHLDIRSSLLGQGTVKGMLRLPDGIIQSDFLEGVSFAIKQFNSHGWQGIVEREERESMKPGQVALINSEASKPQAGRKEVTLSGRKQPKPVTGCEAIEPNSGKRHRNWRVTTRLVPRSVVVTTARPAVPTHQSSSKKGVAMETARSTSEAVAISAEGYPPATVKRARAMLEFLLRQTGLQGGGYQFDVTGREEPLRGSSTPHILFLLGGGSESVLQVRIRSKAGADGVISGHLSLPKGANFQSSFRTLALRSKELNQGGWHEALDGIPPEPPPAHQLRAGESLLSDLVFSEPALAQSSAPVPRSGSRPAVAVSPAGKPLQQGETNMNPSKPFEDEERLKQFLIKAIQTSGVTNGVLDAPSVREFAGKHFNRSDPVYIVAPLFTKLKRLGWAKQVDEGTIQVTQAFIDANRLGITITALPEYHRDRVAHSPKAGHSGNGASDQPTLDELLESRRAMDAAILKEVLKERAARRQTIEDLRRQVQAAEAELVAFEERHAPLISQARATDAGGASTTVTAAVSQTAPH